MKRLLPLLAIAALLPFSLSGMEKEKPDTESSLDQIVPEEMPEFDQELFDKIVEEISRNAPEAFDLKSVNSFNNENNSTNYLDNQQRNLKKTRRNFYEGECTICKKVVQDLKRHMDIHDEVKPYTCSKCKYKSNEYCNCERHIQTKHTPESGACMKIKKNNEETTQQIDWIPLLCSVCSKTFYNKAEHKRHQERCINKADKRTILDSLSSILSQKY